MSVAAHAHGKCEAGTYDMHHRGMLFVRAVSRVTIGATHSRMNVAVLIQFTLATWAAVKEHASLNGWTRDCQVAKS